MNANVTQIGTAQNISAGAPPTSITSLSALAVQIPTVYIQP
jgi:hypothetical protein